MSISWSSSPGSRRRISAASALVLTVGAAALGLLATPSPAEAAEDRHGVAQVVINPGGGVDPDGADGLRVVLNLEEGYDGGWATDASDQLFFADTIQFCCGGVGPNLNIGGDLYGESGASSNEAENGWAGVTVQSTSGSVERGTSTTDATGSGSATLRYTAVKGALTYTMDRTVSYTYPNDYYTDSYTVTIPEGNTDVVTFYKGGDAAPGSSDEGYGIQLTSPVRSVISLNPSSHILVGQREIAGDEPFDGAVTQNYSQPYSVVAAGGDLGFATEGDFHDAGFMTQWTLGSTPGTQTRAQQTFVTFQGTSLTAAFGAGTAAAGSPVLLDLNVVNTQLTPTSPIGYTITLPAGLVVGSGTPTPGCGGTLTAAAGSSTVTLAGGSVPAAGNCVDAVPVVAAAGGTYTVNSASVSAVTGLSNGVGTSSLTVGASPEPPAPPAAPTSVTAVADESSILVSWHAPISGTAVGSYRVSASPGSATCTTTGLSCVLGGVAGTSYTITVTALSPGGAAGAVASVSTAPVAAPAVPASPPNSPLVLATDKGTDTTAVPGEEIVVSGNGFLPYSTVSIVVYSTPIVLGTVTTDGAGAFSTAVTVPADLEAGAHSLVAYGVDPAGAAHSLQLDITVAAATQPVAAAPTTAVQVSSTAGGSLAFTGFSPLPFVVVGAVLLLAGLVLVVGVRSRRRPADEEPVAESAPSPVGARD